MRSSQLKSAVVLSWFVVIVGMPALARAADPDWKAVEQALGKPGQLQAGDVWYKHFWATDDAATLARGLKMALDQTNSQK